jgi:FkbM family methyltransferase
MDVCDVTTRIYMRAQRILRPVRNATTFFGATLMCDLTDFVQRRIYFFRIYEPNLSHLLIRVLKPGDMFLDVGANVGYFSLLASTAVGPSGRVFSIEATPSTYRLLQQNIQTNGCQNISTFNVAATGVRCRVRIVSPDQKNIGRNRVEECETDDVADVEGRPLTELLEDNLHRISVIKIDVEGSEGPVLQDILDSIDRFPKNLVIASELSRSSAEYIAKFQRHGFRVFGLPNLYAISNYLVSTYYFEKIGEMVSLEMHPVTEFLSKYQDYIFQRGDLIHRSTPVATE